MLRVLTGGLRGTLGGSGLTVTDHRGLEPADDLVGLLVVDTFCERKLTDEDLARLGEHALLTGGQAAVLVTAPQVADDFGDTVDVAGGETFLVGLVATGPVARLLDIGLTQDRENLLQTLFPDDIAHADELCVGGRDLHQEITLEDPQDEVVDALTLELPLLDSLDLCGTVVGVDDNVPDVELHDAQVYHRAPPSLPLQGCFSGVLSR